TQGKSPFQYSSFDLLGVPPPVKAPLLPNVSSTHSPSPSNSGKRTFGTVSPPELAAGSGNRFCSKPFLWSLRASSLSLWAAISSSKEERQEAIFCCSCFLGKSRFKPEISSFVNPFIAIP